MDVQFCSAPSTGTEELFPYSFPMGSYENTMGPARTVLLDPSDVATAITTLTALISSVCDG